MNCPMCGSDIPSGVKYCPVCGGDVELAAQRTQQMPVQQQVPQYAAPQQAQAAAQQRVAPQHAVPMTPSVPQASAGGLKEIDTKSMESSPKWPIVLIALLLLVIIGLVLAIFHPWDAGTVRTVQIQGSDIVANQPQTAPADNAAGDGAPAQDVVAEGQPAPVAEAPVVDNGAVTQAVELLTNAYGQLAGMDSRITDTANAFNEHYLDPDQGSRQAYADQANALFSEIAGLKGSVDALDTAGNAALDSVKGQISQMLDCLVHRIDVLAQAWGASASSADPGSADYGMLVADNDSNGINRYKTLYQSLIAGFDFQGAIAGVSA